MKRRIVVFGKYFGEFLDRLTPKEREKVDYGLVLLKTQDRLPSKFVKHIKDGLYELTLDNAKSSTTFTRARPFCGSL